MVSTLHRQTLEWNFGNKTQQTRHSPRQHSEALPTDEQTFPKLKDMEQQTINPRL
jgi:hypothetical protein